MDDFKTGGLLGEGELKKILNLQKIKKEDEI